MQYLNVKGNPVQDDLIDFELTEGQRSLQQTLREFAATELRPGAAEREIKGEYPVEAVTKLRRMGFFGLIFPKRYGGKELALINFAIAVEELARHDPAVAISLIAHTLCANHINLFGTEKQKEEYLCPLVCGEKLGAWALAEHNAGDRSGRIMTTAVRKGDGWLLSGNKSYVTNGTYADILLILASTAESISSNEISSFIVSGAIPGLSRCDLRDKGAFCSSDTVALTLNNVRIPRDNILGYENQGAIQAAEILTVGRIGIAAMAVGIGRARLKEIFSCARGPSSPDGKTNEFQVINWMLDNTMTTSRIVGITPREREVLGWLKQGKSSWEISVILDISESTVYFHVSNIMKKLGASNRPQAVAIASRLGLLNPD